MDSRPAVIHWSQMTRPARVVRVTCVQLMVAVTGVAGSDVGGGRGAAAPRTLTRVTEGAVPPRWTGRGGRPDRYVPGLPTPDRCLVMGVVNVTPDSFSDGGEWFEPADAITHGLRLAAQGADLVDVGGDSTRPGAERRKSGGRRRPNHRSARPQRL